QSMYAEQMFCHVFFRGRTHRFPGGLPHLSIHAPVAARSLRQPNIAGLLEQLTPEDAKKVLGYAVQTSKLLAASAKKELRALVEEWYCERATEEIIKPERWLGDVAEIGSTVPHEQITARRFLKKLLIAPAVPKKATTRQMAFTVLMQKYDVFLFLRGAY
ncbi:hypothetical protein ENBRE01_3531, partial [Enteropsectra breve]